MRPEPARPAKIDDDHTGRFRRLVAKKPLAAADRSHYHGNLTDPIRGPVDNSMNPYTRRLVAALLAATSICQLAAAENSKPRLNREGEAPAEPIAGADSKLGRSLALPQSSTLPTLFIAGDSTAANGAEGARGWGGQLAKFFDPAKVRVDNRARGGRSSRTYITEGLWDSLASELQPGDVVLIQFGHNDGGPVNDSQRARGSLPGLGDDTQEIENEQTHEHETVHTYGWYMRKMIADTRDRGAIPIVLSLTVRNVWDGDRVERGSGRYGAWARELAKREDVPFIDLTNLIADDYEQLGPEAVAKLFPRDHTHTGDEGAQLNARLVVAGFKGLREEMWSPWLSIASRTVPRPAPNFVKIPGVGRGKTKQDESRFLNTPQRADPSLPTLWLVGDSTVRTGRGRGEGGQFGWGDPLENAFDQSQLNVVNRAMGGTGARTYRTGGFWQPVLDQIKRGDVVLIQFGHNDNGDRGACAAPAPKPKSGN